jgi:hypothetical protein
MLGFESVAVFILATVGSQRENYSARVAPLVDGWGAFFPQLYFVFGRNAFDQRYLEQECELLDAGDSSQSHSVTTTDTDTGTGTGTDSSMSNATVGRHSDGHGHSDGHSDGRGHSRGLLARYHQTPLQHRVLTYRCTTEAGNNFFGLFVANCTGEYYGIGKSSSSLLIEFLHIYDNVFATFGRSDLSLPRGYALLFHLFSPTARFGIH